MAVDDEEKRGIQERMNYYRQIIQSYEQFVGSLGIRVPPGINDKLSQIVINMS